MNFNKVFLAGNITRDVTLKHLSGGTTVAEFGMACNRKWKAPSGEDREEVCFVDCSAFAKTGELINQYFAKGKPIFVEGRLKLDQWDDKQTGTKRSKISVVVDLFQFVGSPREADGQDAPPPTERPRSNQPPARPAQRPPAARRPASFLPPGDVGEGQFTDDEIPF